MLSIVFYVNGIVYGYDDDPRYKLTADLFDKYKNEHPPKGYNGTGVVITVEMFGAIVIEVKETEQVTSYLIAHNQKWVDPRLRWDPKKYDGIESIVVPLQKIWRPDTYIYNSIEVKDLVDNEKDFARLNYIGEIEINCPQYVQAFCTIAVHMFPFDTQFCTIAITSNQLGFTEINVTVTPPKYATFRFTGNSEWELCNVSMVYHELKETGLWGIPSVEYQYVFQIKRRSTYYVTVIIIPIFLIATLSIVGIFAPGSKNETGNCVNLGLGTLLALMVLLGIVADRLPKSDDMPLLGL
uniref:Neurotransmitter-gated ion-channel ligand-binding domain-containing protein n=1 Tax=Acrobeloides nanus TaxID=290746 RepID=A0A914C5U2_9BILA